MTIKKVNVKQIEQGSRSLEARAVSIPTEPNGIKHN